MGNKMTVNDLIKKLQKIPNPGEREVCVCIPDLEYVQILDVKEDEPSPGVCLIMINENQLGK